MEEAEWLPVVEFEGIEHAVDIHNTCLGRLHNPAGVVAFHSDEGREMVRAMMGTEWRAWTQRAGIEPLRLAAGGHIGQPVRCAFVIWLQSTVSSTHGRKPPAHTMTWYAGLAETPRAYLFRLLLPTTLQFLQPGLCLSLAELTK